MGVKITRDGNIIKASGWPAGSIVGFVFGILFLIVGILTIFANTTVSLVIIILSNIILYASRRHGNGARNRKLAEEVEKDRQRNLVQTEEQRPKNKINFSDGSDTKYGVSEQINPGAMVEDCIQQLKVVYQAISSYLTKQVNILKIYQLNLCLVKLFQCKKQVAV